MINYSIEKKKIDWDEVAEVILQAPLGKLKRDPNELRRAFEASYAVVFVFDSKKLIGMARALCDGEYQAAIYDVVLLPEYQGKGIGKEMMEKICEQLPVGNIIVYAVPGREMFYKECGCSKMRTAMAKLNQRLSNPNSGYLE